MPRSAFYTHRRTCHASTATASHEADAFHRERRIPVRRGRSRHEAEQSYIRFCFPDTTTADAFRNRFGGECFTHAAVKREAEEDWGKEKWRLTGEYAMGYWANKSWYRDA